MLTSINTSATQYRDVFVRMSALLWLHTCSFEWSPGVTAVCGDLIAWSSIFNSAVHSEGWTHLHRPCTHCTRNLSCSCLAVIQGLWCQSDFSFSGKNVCSSNTSQSLQTPGGAAKHWEDYDSFCFSSAFDTFTLAGWDALSEAGEPEPPGMDSWLSDRQAAVYQDARLLVWRGDGQHRHTQGTVLPGLCWMAWQRPPLQCTSMGPV